MIPTKIAHIKNATVFKMIPRYPPRPVLTPSTIVKTIMPNTSSMIAALMIVCPTSDLIFPSSLRTATEMLTDVAVKIVPMKTASKNLCVPKPSKPQKQSAIIVPITRGVMTPHAATIVALNPDFARDLRFVPSPAENMIRMTPISAIY